jgi:hypothetical protein
MSQGASITASTQPQYSCPSYVTGGTCTGDTVLYLFNNVSAYNASLGFASQQVLAVNDDCYVNDVRASGCSGFSFGPAPYTGVYNLVMGCWSGDWAATPVACTGVVAYAITPPPAAASCAMKTIIPPVADCTTFQPVVLGALANTSIGCATSIAYQPAKKNMALTNARTPELYGSAIYNLSFDTTSNAAPQAIGTQNVIDSLKAPVRSIFRDLRVNYVLDHEQGVFTFATSVSSPALTFVFNGTWAGISFTDQFGVPNDMCLDSTGAFLYTTHGSLGEGLFYGVLRISLTGGRATSASVYSGGPWGQIYGGPVDGVNANALFMYPTACKVGADGSVYVVDGLAGNTIRRINATHTLTILGNYTADGGAGGMPTGGNLAGAIVDNACGQNALFLGAATSVAGIFPRLTLEYVYEPDGERLYFGNGHSGLLYVAKLKAAGESACLFPVDISACNPPDMTSLAANLASTTSDVYAVSTQGAITRLLPVSVSSVNGTVNIVSGGGGGAAAGRRRALLQALPDLTQVANWGALKAPVCSLVACTSPSLVTITSVTGSAAAGYSVAYSIGCCTGSCAATPCAAQSELARIVARSPPVGLDASNVIVPLTYSSAKRYIVQHTNTPATTTSSDHRTASPAPPSSQSLSTLTIIAICTVVGVVVAVALIVTVVVLLARTHAPPVRKELVEVVRLPAPPQPSEDDSQEDLADMFAHQRSKHHKKR